MDAKEVDGQENMDGKRKKRMDDNRERERERESGQDRDNNKGINKQEIDGWMDREKEMRKREIIG